MEKTIWKKRIGYFWWRYKKSTRSNNAESLFIRASQNARNKSHEIRTDKSCGNADHFNLLFWFAHKEKSKSEALKKFLEKEDAKPTVKFSYTGEPSGHKLVNLTIEGEIFGRTPIVITSVIEDEISINGAGTVVDAIRMAQLLVDRKKQKEAKNACAFLMKTPPKQMSDSEALKRFNKLLNNKKK